MQVAEAGPASPSSRATAKELFEVVWLSLSEVIGTAATASLLRRSCRRARARDVDLDGLEIARRGFNHEYALPPLWSEHGAPGVDSFRIVAEELFAILYALTGHVLVRRLASHPKLRHAGLFALPEQS